MGSKLTAACDRRRELSHSAEGSMSGQPEKQRINCPVGGVVCGTAASDIPLASRCTQNTQELALLKASQTTES